MLTRTDAFMYLMEVDKRLAERLGEQPLMDTALVRGGIAPERAERLDDEVDRLITVASDEEWREHVLSRVQHLSELEANRQSIEDRIQELRRFENTYREQLLAHLARLETAAPDYEVQERILIFLQILENPNDTPVWVR